MTRSSGWKRLFGILCLIVLLAAGACSSEGDLVATVNGVDIYMAELEEPADDEDEVVDRVAFEDRLLSLVITRVVLTKALEEYGIDPDQDPHRAAAEEEYQNLRAQVQAQNPDYEAFLEEQGITDERVRLVAMQRAVINALGDELLSTIPEMTAEEVEEVFERSKVRLTESVCTTHVLLESAGEAQAVLERALAGESMNDLARELSIEPSAAESGGDLGCLPASSFVAEYGQAIVTAELMVPFGPVESQFGHHVILVTDRTDPALADHEADIRSENKQRQRNTVIEEWFLRVSTESDVHIEPRYGTWTTEPTPRILPPA
ncbi:MAG: peptidylprolyl isomerase [Actinomycetia bacterium]|nr:peptidylprolyl isomerase [Actinomycetes bacterium]